MSTDEGSLREIRAALALLTSRLDHLVDALARAESAPRPELLAGEPLDEAARARFTALRALLAIGPDLPRNEAFVLAADRVLHWAGADCAAVFLLTVGGELEVAAHRGFGPRAPSARADAGIVGRALRDREPIQGGAGEHDRDILLREHGLASALALPICASRGAPLAVLFAGRRRAADFGPEALDVLALLVDRLGLALGSLPPPEPTGGLIPDLDLGRTAGAVVREAVMALGAPVLAVLLPEDERLVVAASVGGVRDADPPDPRTEAIATVIRSRRPWTPAGGASDETLARFLGAPPRLVAPLVFGDTLVALLVAGGPDPVAAARLDPLLAPAAAAVRNARLYAAAVDALTERRASEAERPSAPPPAPARSFANLLAVILGRLGAARERVRDPTVARELGVAEEAAWCAAEAVRALLGFAPGHRGGALVPLDVASVLRAAVEQARARWTAREAPRPEICLEFEPLPPVRGSADDLREAFDHLLENAAEALSDARPITVRVGWDGGRRVEIVIEDQGAGMDDAARAQALEPFFSTKGSGRLGLGLPVAQAILARHHGALEIESAPGRGTTVRVTLPTMATARQPTCVTGGSAARVLVVEDETSVRDALVALVTQEGHVAFTAADSPEALAIAERELIDVLVVDLALPHGSGLEVARAVRRLRPGTPVILLTAWPGEVPETRLGEAGVSAVIEKPVGLAEVRAALAMALASRGA